MASTLMAHVVLLHGWLGSPQAFGILAEILEGDGHRILPILRSYRTTGPRTLEELADQFEEEFSHPRPDVPVTLVAHSMGGLLARVWMLRHYTAHGKRPPVERIIECAVPRHGTFPQTAGRLAIRCGLVPGAALARQMLCPNPFLWDLAWGELEHLAMHPPVIALAGIEETPSFISRLAGGEESDTVVPAAFCQPNAVFLRPGQSPDSLPPRPFRVFRGFRHNGPRGLLAHLHYDRTGKVAEMGDEVRAALRLAVRGDDASVNLHGADGRTCLTRAFLVVRYAAGQAVTAEELSESGKAVGAPVRPTAQHAEGLALFALRALQPGGRALERFRIRCGAKEWDSAATLGALRGGDVAYLDLRG
jgi:pimeloyl-ACP methyl ester carboxylesterase